MWMASTVLFCDACIRCLTMNDLNETTGQHQVMIRITRRFIDTVKSALSAMVHVDDAVLYAPGVMADKILPDIPQWSQWLADREHQLRNIVQTAGILRDSQPLIYLVWSGIVYIVCAVLGYLLPNSVLLFLVATVPMVFPLLSYHIQRYYNLHHQSVSGKHPVSVKSDESNPSWLLGAKTKAYEMWEYYQQAASIPDSFHPDPTIRPSLISASSSFSILSPTYWSSVSPETFVKSRPVSASVAGSEFDTLNNTVRQRSRKVSAPSELQPTIRMRSSSMTEQNVAAAAILNNVPQSWLSYATNAFIGGKPPVVKFTDMMESSELSLLDEMSVEDGYAFVKDK